MFKMKKNIFLVTAGMIFTLSSCNSDENEASKTVQGELSVIATRTLIPEPEKEPAEPGFANPPVVTIEEPKVENLAFTASDIKSFNVTTREIVFNNLTVEELSRRVGSSSKLTFSLRGEPLFESLFIEPGYSSYSYNDLIFVFWESKFYLSDGYPMIQDWESLPWPNKEEFRRLREENAKKRKSEWDKFIRYLTEDGKIIR
jgi:hypothetical protein